MHVIETLTRFFVVGLLFGATANAGATFELRGRVTKKHPDFYIGLIDLGMILVGQQENDRALDFFTRAQTLRPEHSWAYIGLGMVLNNKQDYRGASQHLEKAVALEPSSIRIKKGDADGAARALESYLAQFPDAQDRNKVEQIVKKLGH